MYNRERNKYIGQNEGNTVNRMTTMTAVRQETNNPVIVPKSVLKTSSAFKAQATKAYNANNRTAVNNAIQHRDETDIGFRPQNTIGGLSNDSANVAADN